MKFGYYWIRFKGSNENTIGYYGDDFNGEYGEEFYNDGSGVKGDIYTWIVIGSDDIYKNKEIEVIEEIKEVLNGLSKPSTNL